MILNGGTYGGKRYLSENAVHEMTSRQTASNIKQSYGFGWGIEGGSFGHGGAYKTNLHIDPKLGLVTVFMVQQGSDWPNGDGGKILPAFEQAADTEVLASLPPTPQELAPGTPVMQDNFTDKVADIAGHAPTTGTGVWSADYSPNTVIASDGAEALGNVNGGQQGAGAAIASYPFTPATDTLYVLTIRFDFVSHATKDCWAGFGFSGQKAPWMMVRPQNPDGGGSGAAGFYENPDGSGETSMDWSAYAAFYPAFNATIALNTRTNEVAYYINSLLEKKVASAAPSIDHLYFKFYQTGNAAAIKSIGLTAQPVP
jgi:hypothetical protein